MQSNKINTIIQGSSEKPFCLVLLSIRAFSAQYLGVVSGPDRG